MDAQALSALISATAGLLGALIGFAGAQVANKRIIAQSREQRRFERAQEMRAEVIPRLFVRLENMADIFAFVLYGPLHFAMLVEEMMSGVSTERLEKKQVEEHVKEWTEETSRNRERLKKERQDMRDYFRLHDIWLPDEISQPLRELIDEYMKQTDRVVAAHNEFSRMVLDAPDDLEDRVQDIQERTFQVVDRYMSLTTESKDWFEGESRRRRVETLWSTARKILGVEE
jgi:hypothetical protein